MSVIDELTPKLLWKRFDEITKIPRCSKHEERISEYVLSFAKEHDLESKTDKVGNIVIKKPANKGSEDKPTVVLQCHLDMVCEKNSDVDFDFSKDPIQMKKEGDFITADGTTLGADDGIGIAAALAILEDESLETGPIEALFTIDEESGLTGAFALEPDMLSGRILVNLDSEEWGLLTVGCAGGGNSEINLPITREDNDHDTVGMTLKVSGLRGGHSGIDIHEQRANAVKVLSRLLWKLSADHEIHLEDLAGGDKHNAIPRESYASIAVKKDQIEEVKQLLEAEEEHIAKEFKPIDPGLKLTVSESENPSKVLDGVSFDKLVHLLHALPHGVDKMSYDIPDLVETSTNFAKASIEGEKAVIMLSSRSMVMSTLLDFRDRIHATAALSGATVVEEEPYPGWKPDLDSKVLALSKKIFIEKYGKEPDIKAIHAGLECGIIGEKFAGMDMVSIGPTLQYPHSPEERVQITTVEKFYDHILDILKSV